jgi:dTDP-4-amino-4,6-dideoxygalactose transaminase
VHLYGQPVDLAPILEIARRQRLIVIEDACQAHGAQYRDRPAGSWGDAACFSFYPSKNLGAYGDGGMVTTSDLAIAEKIRMLRNYGQAEKYSHTMLGYNRRLDTLQAAVLRVKLRKLDEWNAARNRIAQQYGRLLSSTKDVILPVAAAGRTHVYHLYVIQHPQRDALRAHLSAAGISTVMHYPIPAHLQECYRYLGVAPGSLPVSESAAKRVLSLPMYPELTDEMVEYVCGKIKEFCSD